LAAGIINAKTEQNMFVAQHAEGTRQANAHLGNAGEKEKAFHDANRNFGVVQSGAHRDAVNEGSKNHAAESLLPRVSWTLNGGVRGEAGLPKGGPIGVQGHGGLDHSVQQTLDPTALGEGLLAHLGRSPADHQHQANVRAHDQFRDAQNQAVNTQVRGDQAVNDGYRDAMNRAGQAQYAGRVAAAHAEAGGALSGVNQAERLEIAGADAKHAADLQAIDLRADGRLQAVETQRQAGLDAAELTKQAAVASHLAQEVSSVVRHTSESFRF
jgi:hypothetical protein